jgi:hypothetical protein
MHCAQSDLIGFFRHGQEGLNKTMKMRGDGKCAYCRPPLWRAEKTGKAKPPFLAAAPAKQTLGTKGTTNIRAKMHP